MIKIIFDRKNKQSLAFFDDEVVGRCTIQFDCEKDCYVIDHTFVDPKYRGYKLAEKLVDKVVDFVRKENKKVYATCSYAAFKFDRDRKNYEDILFEN